MDAALVDSIRLEANSRLDPKKKSSLGQFMTPSNIAAYMASLLTDGPSDATLLDCGAGIGSLTIAAAKRLKRIRSVEVWEIDSVMREYLQANLETLGTEFRIHGNDFIEDACLNISLGIGTRFTHAVINPPYKKISSASRHRQMARTVGIETVNLYTAFLALTILLLQKDGQVVVIIPRSFCNGPYYKPFREMMLRECSLEHIHVFESRSKAFKDDDVLQENIILKLVRGKAQGDVVVSSSHDQTMSDYTSRNVPFSEILKPGDAELFIHVPTHVQSFDQNRLFSCGLAEIGMEVSTGPVVDFRVKEWWLTDPTPQSVPLLYPHHFVERQLSYPRAHKKPNALARSGEVDKWLYPDGNYVIVRRFSAKEESRRVVAYVYHQGALPTDLLGFENHWNVFHRRKRGLDALSAKGLACFLNSTQLDDYFRVFSGHTQVNATDLKNMRYPSTDELRRLGSRYVESMTQDEIDGLVDGIDG